MVEKRPIGDSGIEVTPLALGGNVFDWTADEPTSFAVLDAFVDAGGMMIDTADVYSAWVPGHQGGESEALIGRWLKRNPNKRAKVVIATKVGFLDGTVVDGQYVPAMDPDTIARACEASLRRLGVETIDLYYQHKDSDTVPLADSLGAFELLREQGKIRATGLSNFASDRIDEAVSTARRYGFMPPVALQPRYNLVEREGFEEELRDAAISNSLAVFPYYGLANGFLTGKYRSEADLDRSLRGQRVAGFLEDRGRRVLEVMDEVAAETGAALATVALAWLMAQPAITAPIASATSVAQLAELVAAIELRLSLDQIARLDGVSCAPVPA
jgi:aryl-alcohol dehydrogenase-like predicted oxidoreductase